MPDKPKPKKRSGYHRKFPSTVGREERHEATLMRSKRLLLAALRVWELKHPEAAY